MHPLVYRLHCKYLRKSTSQLHAGNMLGKPGRGFERAVTRRVPVRESDEELRRKLMSVLNRYMYSLGEAKQAEVVDRLIRLKNDGDLGDSTILFAQNDVAEPDRFDEAASDVARVLNNSREVAYRFVLYPDRVNGVIAYRVFKSRVNVSEGQYNTPGWEERGWDEDGVVDGGWDADGGDMESQANLLSTLRAMHQRVKALEQSVYSRGDLV